MYFTSLEQNVPDIIPAQGSWPFFVKALDSGSCVEQKNSVSQAWWRAKKTRQLSGA